MGGSSSSPVNPDGYYIGLNSSRDSFVLNNNSSPPPHYYVVQNIGRTPIIAEVSDKRKDIIVVRKILPGKTEVFDGKNTRYSYLKLKNHEVKRAIAHCRGGNLVSEISVNLGRKINILSNIAIAYAKCFAPRILTTLALSLLEFYNTFWPEEEPNIWEEISEKIYCLLDENTKAIIKTFLENELKVYKEKLKTLIDESNQKIKIHRHFMAIAYDFIGLERKFQYSSTIRNHEKINLSVLPLLVHVLSLKMNFYMIGIKFSKAIGLTTNDILQIKKYASDTYEHTCSYIYNMEKSAVDHVYNHVDPEDMFNQIMEIRTYLAIHGQYLPVWKYRLENHVSKEEIYNPMMCYSIFFGKKTPDLFAQATAEEVPPPLCPKLINGRRNKLKYVQIYLWLNGVIFGAKLCFENGDEYAMGTRTSRIETMELNERKILKITAYGEGKIDCLHFLLSDKSEKTFGKKNSNICHEFSLKDHHIPSFYLSNDSVKLGGQAANFAVSFQWYTTPVKPRIKNYFYLIYEYLTK